MKSPKHSFGQINQDDTILYWKPLPMVLYNRSFVRIFVNLLMSGYEGTKLVFSLLVTIEILLLYYIRKYSQFKHIPRRLEWFKIYGLKVCHIPYLYTHGLCIGYRCMGSQFYRNLLKAKVKWPLLACQLSSLFFATLFVKLKFNIVSWYEITSIHMIEILQSAWINMNLQIYLHGWWAF